MSDAARKRAFAKAVISQTTSEASESVRRAQIAGVRLQRALYRLLGGTEVASHVRADEPIALEARAADVREARRALEFAQEYLPTLNDLTELSYEDEA